MSSHRRSAVGVAVAGVATALLVAVGPTEASPVPTCVDQYDQVVEATIVGTDGDDVLLGTPDADVMVAGAGDDRVDGGGGWDVICGDEGDDVIDGGVSARGGPGNDTVRASRHGYGGDGQDRLEGSTGNDVLVGGRGRDLLFGNDGHDNLIGGRGDDRVHGGAGSDFVAADPGDDVVDGSTHPTEPTESGWYVLRCGDWLYWKSPASKFDAEDIELRLEDTPPYDEPVRVDLAAGTAYSRDTGHDTFLGIESATGTPTRDVLDGTVDENCLWSYNGDDHLSGRGGADSLSTGKGADHVRGGAGDDVLSLRTGPATARGGAGVDWLSWVGATDIDLATGVVRNTAGRSSARGVENVFEDVLRGGVLHGDAGPNVLYGRRVFGRGGDDVLWGRRTDGGRGVDNCVGGPSVRCELSDEEGLPWPALLTP